MLATRVEEAGARHNKMLLLPPPHPHPLPATEEEQWEEVLLYNV
jgi:hypothetical protein